MERASVRGHVALKCALARYGAEALVTHFRESGVLATGLNYPVVPRGDEEIRFQLAADHTPADIDEALEALNHFSR